MLSTDDRYEISEILALHAHISDENQLDRLDELFTPDAVYDMTASGMGAFNGMDAIRAAAAGLAGSGHAPLAHFVTNIVITSTDDNEAAVLSKALMIMADGSPHAVTYADTLRRHDGRWRISHRIITPARAPQSSNAS